MRLKVKVIGCGGIGSCIIPVLCKMVAFNTKYEESEITFIDGDKYEERNKERQNFIKIGPKAGVTRELYENQYPNVEFYNFNDFLNETNAVKYIRENDVVFGCVDNHTTRKLLSQRCKDIKNVLLISGGNEFTDGALQVYYRKNNVELTRPLDNEDHPEISNPQDKHPEVVLREAGCDVKALQGSPQLLVTNNLVAAHMLCVFQSYLDERLEKSKIEKVYVDVLSNDARAVKTGE